VDAFQIIRQNYPLVIEDRKQPFAKQAASPSGQDDCIPTQRAASDALVGI
jgi:hypothetical protein